MDHKRRGAAGLCRGLGGSGIGVTQSVGGSGASDDRARSRDPGQGSGEAAPPHVAPKLPGATARRGVCMYGHQSMQDAPQ